jgi:uncharacterized OB-fold protein
MATKDRYPQPELLPQQPSQIEASTLQTRFSSASPGLRLTDSTGAPPGDRSRQSLSPGLVRNPSAPLRTFSEGKEEEGAGEGAAGRGLKADKPIPTPTLETAPYWEGCRRHQLRIQRCSNCQRYQFFPRIYCSKCFSEQIEWVNASGRAKVLSFTIVRRPVSPAFANEIPYIVALVTLEEGPQMMTNIVECAPEEVTIGLPVEVVFEDRSDQISIPQFRPRRS